MINFAVTGISMLAAISVAVYHNYDLGIFFIIWVCALELDVIRRK